MRTRIVVWGVVVALVAVAAGLVVVAGGGDRDDEAAAPRLPLDLAGSQGTTEQAAAGAGADGLAIGLAPTRYVAGEDLPARGGDAAAYPIPVTAERVAALADAFGIEGEPAEQDGSWHVEGNGLALDAYGPGGTWSAYALAAPGAASGQGPDTPQSSPASPPATGAGGGAPAPTTTDSTIVCVTTPCEPAPASDAPVTATAQARVERPTEPQPVQECPADPGGGSCVPPCEPGPAVTCPAGPAVPATTVPGTAVPADPGVTTTTTPAGPASGPLPQQEARDLAAHVLAAAGFTPEDVPVDATMDSERWMLTFQPVVDGHDAPGLAGSLVVGTGGVESASGYFAPGDPLGDYPLLTSTQAIERLNAPGDVSVMDGAAATAEGTAEADRSGGVSAAVSGSSSAAATEDTGAGSDGTAAPTTGTVFGPGAEPMPLPAPAPDGSEPAPAPEPAPEPEPVEVTLTGVEVVYTAVPSWDGSGAYVVPSYRFTSDVDAEVLVNALADDALRPPSPD